MTIRDPKRLQTVAAHRVENAPGHNRILLIYCGITLAVCLVATLGQLLLGQQLDAAGGLRKLGLRSLLTTMGTVLPIAANVVLLGLRLGLTAVMLRMARRQYVSPMTLKAGLERFFPLLRWLLLQAAVYGLIAFAAVNVATTLYLFTPLSNGLVRYLEPMLGDPQALLDAMTNSPELLGEFLAASWPMHVLMLLLTLGLIIPMSYRLRLGDYVLLDEPKAGAFRAFSRSRELMKGNCWALFRLDLHLWWFYGLTALVAVIDYGAELLALLGVALPGSFDLWSYAFYGLSLLAQAGVYYFLYCRVGVTYALAYESLLPKQQPQEGLVLGNIFRP